MIKVVLKSKQPKGQKTIRQVHRISTDATTYDNTTQRGIRVLKPYNRITGEALRNTESTPHWIYEHMTSRGIRKLMKKYQAGRSTDAQPAESYTQGCRWGLRQAQVQWKKYTGEKVTG